MKFGNFLILLFTVAILTACDDTTTSENSGGNSGGDTQTIQSFNISKDVVKSGESFNITMQLGNWKSATLRIRPSGTTTSVSLQSMISDKAYDSNITLTYSNGKITSPVTQDYGITTAGDYQIFLNACDNNNICVDSPIFIVTFDDGTLTTINLEWIILQAKMFTFDYGINKIIVIHNNSATAQYFEFIPATNLFRASFERNHENTFTLPVGEYDNLTIDVIRGDAETLGIGYHQKDFTVTVDSVGKTYTARVGGMITADEECVGNADAVGNCLDDSQSKFELSNAKPLAGFALGESLDYLKKFNATLKFDADFFNKFKLDERTTCRINLDNTISMEKQCFIFILKKDSGSSNLTLTGRDPTDGTPISKKIIFNAN